MKKRFACNPYLPSWEYIPDGEPYIFGDRVYVYGSHDRFNGHVFCLGDYVCWSAPVDDLGDWRCEGTIYMKTDDPLNPDGSMCLYAPDVTRGADGRYYLYYVLDKVDCVSVAVCDEPAGRYSFLGYVRHPDGTLLGKGPGDQPQFDPGVITMGTDTWLYTGFCDKSDTNRDGAMATKLGADMLTVTAPPRFVIPSAPRSKGTAFEEHPFFEAPSIRKRGDVFYLIYSSTVMHELCYATSAYPDRDFVFGGVVVSNNDLGIDTYKPARMPAYYGGNNHGSIIEIGSRWYIFYHRQTHGTTFCRQGCIEPISFREDGSIIQAEMTSQGANPEPLPGRGEYPAYIACNLFCREESIYTAQAAWMDNRFPLITQDGRDGDEETGYVANMMDGACAGFKYFHLSGVRSISIRVRGYCRGVFEVRTQIDGEVYARIPVDFTNVWTEYTSDISLPDGKQSLYFTYNGGGRASLASFCLE